MLKVLTALLISVHGVFLHILPSFFSTGRLDRQTGPADQQRALCSSCLFGVFTSFTLHLISLCLTSPLQVNELSNVPVPVMLMPDDFKAYSKIKVDNHLFNK